MTTHQTDPHPPDPGRTTVTDTPHTEAAALLRRAAARITRCGLHRADYWPHATDTTPPQPGGWYIEGDPCCAIGALAIEAGVDHAIGVGTATATRPALAAAVDALAALIPTGRCIQVWNDDPHRTAHQVAAALTRAAGQLDSRAGGGR